MRHALTGLARDIATPRVAKFRLFVWLPILVLPDTRTVVIARDDDVTFGVLHSRFHAQWALALGSRHGDGDEGGRPTYNSDRCFEMFPFPEGLTPNSLAATQAAQPHAAAIAAAARTLVEARNRWLNPPELAKTVPEVVPGFPDRIIPKNAEVAALLKKRTFTALYNTRGMPQGACWTTCMPRSTPPLQPRMAGQRTSQRMPLPPRPRRGAVAISRSGSKFARDESMFLIIAKPVHKCRQFLKWFV
jgi:hypothetical protein